jgi:hypothetical protein
MDVARLIAGIKADERYREQIVHEERFPGRPPSYAYMVIVSCWEIV